MLQSEFAIGRGGARWNIVSFNEFLRKCAQTTALSCSIAAIFYTGEFYRDLPGKFLSDESCRIEYTRVTTLDRAKMNLAWNVRLALDPQFFELAIKGRETQSHELGRTYLVAAGFIQSAFDMVFFVEIKRGAKTILVIEFSAVGLLPR